MPANRSIVEWYDMVGPDGTSAATPELLVNTGATPGIRFRRWKFSDGAAEYVYCFGRAVEWYNNSDALRIKLPWGLSGTGGGNCIWRARWLTVDDASTDLDTANFDTADEQSITIAGPTTIGHVVYDTIDFTQAQADDIAAGSMVVLSIERDGADASDTTSQDAYLYGPPTVYLQ